MKITAYIFPLKRLHKILVSVSTLIGASGDQTNRCWVQGGRSFAVANTPSGPNQVMFACLMKRCAFGIHSRDLFSF